jgi:hypothetical protein
MFFPLEIACGQDATLMQSPQRTDFVYLFGKFGVFAPLIISSFSVMVKPTF